MGVGVGTHTRSYSIHETRGSCAQSEHIDYTFNRLGHTIVVGEGCPIISHIFIGFGNIYNMLRYFNEKPPYNNTICAAWSVVFSTCKYSGVNFFILDSRRIWIQMRRAPAPKVLSDIKTHLKSRLARSTSYIEKKRGAMLEFEIDQPWCIKGY